jgi:hypothetical protein
MRAYAAVLSRDKAMSNLEFAKLYQGCAMPELEAKDRLSAEDNLHMAVLSK